MKRTLLLFLFFGLNLLAQSRKGEFALAPDTDSHALYVCFSERLVFEREDYFEVLAHVDGIEGLIEEYEAEFYKGIPISDEKITELSLAAKANGFDGKSALKLRNILKINIQNPTNARLLAFAEKLEKLQEVEYCSLVPLKPILPPTDIAPVTPDYESNQTYLDANPGVNMRYAWALGLAGSGIRIRDVEYGFNKNHEELVDRNVFVAPGMTISASATATYTEHGTSVLGIMYADKGAYGISGMAYNASEAILYPEWQQSGYNRINAITVAIQNSVAGDVIVYEMQTYGQGSNYVPAEFENTVWDLTKAATDAGIVIVEAAANGNQNLDSAYYAPYRNRGNSGAIIVGGGTANTLHDRISYSTYGSRVDVQGWASNVRACGYGDLIMLGGDFNQGYTNFSGTSSATPIVASCVVVLQSYYHSLTGSYMTGPALRQLLQQTGIAQGTGVAGNIGPLPDMQAAILQLNQTLSVSETDTMVFTAFPNPVANSLSVLVPETVNSSVQLEIFNALGQKVLEFVLHSGLNEYNLESLPKGIYFIKATDGKKTTTKKIIKN